MLQLVAEHGTTRHSTASCDSTIRHSATCPSQPSTKRLSAAVGTVSILAGKPGAASWADGTPDSSLLSQPRALCQDGTNPDNLFFLDQTGRVVRLLDLATGGLTEPWVTHRVGTFVIWAVCNRWVGLTVWGMPAG